MKIAVLCGGISLERSVSLVSGLAVYKALKGAGYNVHLIDPAFGKNPEVRENDFTIDEEHTSVDEISEFDSFNIVECIYYLKENDFTFAFNLLHGTYGEDGYIQGLLELAGISHSGTNSFGCTIMMDKPITKQIALVNGMVTPQWDLITSKDEINIELAEEIRSSIGKKMIIKPANQGSAVGIKVIKDGNIDEILDGIRDSIKFSGAAMVEEFIDGREITVGILNGRALPIVEIFPKEGFYDFKNKYQKGSSEYICPADIEPDLSEFIQDQALLIWQLCGGGDFGRVDFRLNSDNVAFLLESNTVPGFTELSLFPMAAKEEGIDFLTLCETIVELGEKR